MYFTSPNICSFFFLICSIKTNTAGTGAIFSINGYIFDLIWHKFGIFLCDSHSRNEEGFITSDSATVLLKFTLDDAQNYIEEVYMLLQNVQVFIYQIH